MNKLPEYFRPILWSYDFDALDVQETPKAVIVNAVNYGKMKYWKWLFQALGHHKINEIIKNTAASEFRPPALELFLSLFRLDRPIYRTQAEKVHTILTAKNR